MKTYIKFVKDIYHDTNLVWKAGHKYLVTLENDELFYFGNGYAISKTEIDKKFKIECEP